MDDKDRLALAFSANTPVEVLTILAKHEDAQIRHLVAGNPSTPIEVLAYLAKDETSWVRSSVASNDNTPDEVLAQLVDDEDYDVIEYVAQNPNASAETLTKLSECDDWDVRWQVAIHPNTPVEILIKLAQKDDEGDDVRCSVARNPNTPVEILRELAKSDEWIDRFGVAENPNTPIEILVVLTEDEEEKVCVMAEQSIAMRKGENKVTINIGTARITGLTKPFYYFEHRCSYVFDIMFEDTSTLMFKNLPFIEVGETEEEAISNYNKFLQNFENANIHEGDSIAVIFDNSGDILAIGKQVEDVWIDVDDKFKMKSFEELGIDITLLKVY